MKNNRTAIPPAMILCGGRGTRLREITELLPKPMVTVGTQPIVWHIMRIYAAYGVNRFILCLGYKKEAFIDYFNHLHSRVCDMTITIGGETLYHGAFPEAGWEITLADTGLDTATGGRIARAAKYLRPDDRDFFLTYGDGVADIDIDALLNTHKKAGKMITCSAVHPAGRFGKMSFKDGLVAGFEPDSGAGEYVNGGFMALRREAVDRYIGDDDCFFEERPMLSALRDGQLYAYRHDGFWQCMDTPREYELLNQLWRDNRAPWRKGWQDV